MISNLTWFELANHFHIHILLKKKIQKMSYKMFYCDIFTISQITKLRTKKNSLQNPNGTYMYTKQEPTVNCQINKS